MFKRIFIDTNPIIYFLENQQPYAQKVRNFIVDALTNNSEFYTSTVTDSEYLVKPFSMNDIESVNAYKTFIKKLNILKSFVSERIAEQAAKIRAKYPSIKLPDAMQLAASLDANCDAFLTNDIQLKQVSEVNVVCLGDL